MNLYSASPQMSAKQLESEPCTSLTQSQLIAYAALHCIASRGGDLRRLSPVTSVLSPDEYSELRLSQVCSELRLSQVTSVLSPDECSELRLSQVTSVL